MGVPVLSYEAIPTPESFLEFLQENRVSNVATVPTLLRGVMALGAGKLAEYDLRLRCISSCGEPLNSEVIRLFQETLGLTPRDHFGSSENGLPLGNFNALDSEVKPGSMGLPMPGFEMSMRFFGTDGSPQAISRDATRLDTSGSRGGPTMSSRAPDTASDHSRSKARFCITLRSRKPLSWANPIR